MIRIPKNTVEYLEALQSFNRYVLTPNFGYFFSLEEEMPKVPDEPTYSSNEVAELQLVESETLEHKWVVRNKTQQELLQELEAKANEIDSQVSIEILSKALIKSLEGKITDVEIDTFAELFPYYRVGKAYKIGERFSLDNVVYEVIQAHTSQLDWRPSELPALYKRVNNPVVIPDFKQPTGAHDTYKKGDKVMFNGSVWESTIDNNSWSPVTYPQGWKKL